MSFFERLTGRKSAKSAKERLQMVLIHDRTDLTPAVLEALKEELLAVIARHLDIDAAAMRVEIENEGRSQRLIADIPLRPAARRKS
ncbi:MAG: cell division topological specificity factor MinE [Anaerolineales bacterium]